MRLDYNKEIKRLLLVCAITSVVGACGRSEVLAAQNELDRVRNRLKQEIGTRPEASVNFVNGHLKIVEVTFNADDVGSLSVRDLQSQVEAAIYSGMTAHPEEVLVSLSSRR